MAEQPYKYWAFISYSHQDRTWASWLHKALETYRVPNRLVGREHWSGTVPRRLLPIFRDRDELSSSAELGTVLNEALRQSRHLIVICSPQAANSRWVNEEIKTFKAMGRSAHVLPIIVGGEPDVSHLADKAALECLPAALRFEVDGNGKLTDRRAEPIAADARGGQDGRRTARLKLIAGLIGVGLDELRQRERQRQLLQRFFASAAVVALGVLAGLGWRWQQAEKQGALAAQALKVRTEQLYENGRQELLAHNEARAAVYLNEAYKLGVDTPALRFMLARAMRTVDAQVLRVNTGSGLVRAALSPDGERFLTFGQDFRLTVWNARTGQPVYRHPIEASAEYVSMRFSAAGKWIALDSADTSGPLRLRILEAASGALVKDVALGGRYRQTFQDTLGGQEQWIAYLQSDHSVGIEEIAGPRRWHLPGQYTVARFCRDRQTLIVGTDHGEVMLRDPLSGRTLRRFPGLRGAVQSVSSSAGCKSVVAGTDEGEIRLWDADTGDLLMSGGHPRPLIDVELNAAGSRLVSQTLGEIGVWNGSGALLYATKFFDYLNNISAASPNAELLASNQGSRLSIIDPQGWKELYTLDGHLGAVRHFAFGATDSQFISAGPDGAVVLWKLPRNPIEEFRVQAASLASGHAAPEADPATAVFSHRGDSFFYGGSAGTGVVHGERPWRIAGAANDSGISAAAFSADDGIVAVGQRSGSIHFHDARSGAPVMPGFDVGGRIWELAFAAGAEALAVVVKSDALRAQLRQVQDGAVVAEFALDWPKGQALSADGERYVVGNGNTVRLWDIRKQQFLWTRQLPSAADAEITVLMFSADNREVLAVQKQRRAFLLDATDGRILSSMDEALASGLFAAAVGVDGSVALGDFSKSVFLWRPDSHQVEPLLGHTGEVRSVSFSPDGKFLLSTAADGAARLWDVARRELLESIAVQDGPPNWYSAGFNARGDQALVDGTDGAVKRISFGSETRSPEEIAALLRCRVAWRAVDADLAPVAPDATACVTR